MKRDKLQAQLKDLVVKQMSMSHQMDATRKLHEAAAMVSNNPLCEMYREQLHSLLDLQLDTVMSINLLTRQMIDAQD